MRFCGRCLFARCRKIGRSAFTAREKTGYAGASPPGHGNQSKSPHKNPNANNETGPAEKIKIAKNMPICHNLALGLPKNFAEIGFLARFEPGDKIAEKRAA